MQCTGKSLVMPVYGRVVTMATTFNALCSVSGTCTADSG